MRKRQLLAGLRLLPGIFLTTGAVFTPGCTMFIAQKTYNAAKEVILDPFSESGDSSREASNGKSNQGR
jgi:hypothetical protein